MSEASRNEVHVLAGVIFDGAGRVLLAQRPQGKELAGYWEFPGGKLELGETRYEALARELHEELGIHIGPARPLARVRHVYPHKRVLLDFWIVREFRGEASSLDGQLLRWCSVEELPRVPLLPADQPMLRLVNLPEAISERCGPGYEVLAAAGATTTDRLTGVLCRDAAAATRAVAAGAHFIVLERPLPAGELTQLCLTLDAPVFAQGLSLAEAWAAGASGTNQLPGPRSTASQAIDGR